MPSIEYPQKKDVENFTIEPIFIKADNDSVNQYCTENGLTLDSYEKEEKRFANDGSYTYVYYEDSKWKIASGYEKVVRVLNYV